MIDYLIDLCREAVKKHNGLIATPEDIADVVDQRLGSNGQLPSKVSLKNIPASNQGNTMRCSSYGTTRAELIYHVRSLKQKSIDISPTFHWEQQLKHTDASEKNGAYLHKAVDVLIERAQEFINFKPKKRPYKPSFIPKGQWKQELAKKNPIITGSGMAFPSVDSDYFWRPTPISNGGHLYLCVGYDDKKGAYEMFNTSWGKWGQDNNGRFWVKYKDFDQLFRGYVLRF